MRFKEGKLDFFSNKKAQVTIFIIVAILIVAGVALYFTFRGSFTMSSVPKNMEPIYNSFISCVEENTLFGIGMLESQGGYIKFPTYVSGSSYMPFSSQLDFMGTQIPYWYYVSGNNIPTSQVPTLSDMQKQLSDFINLRVEKCEFETFYEQGFSITKGNASSSVKIEDDKVVVNLNMPLSIERENESAFLTSYEVSVKSNLGGLYSSALEVYNYEGENMFLEEYAVDVLRLYAPVDGVELTCSPLTWNANNVFETLKEAIESNTQALRGDQSDYSLSKKENQYFVLDLPSDYEVRFLNSRNWSSAYEVSPSEGPLMMSKPVGNQEGLGILGFCYVAYHFVYDVKYPVLVQVSSGEEIFQFPFAVVIEDNNPRESLNGGVADSQIDNFCEYKNTPISVSAYDTQLNLVPAEISYKCMGTTCTIGETSSEGATILNFPQCGNGQIIAKSDKYREEKGIFSTINSARADIILDRLYELNVNLELDSRNYDGEAIINFVSNDSSQTLIYPENTKVNLSSGQYEVSVYIYKNSSLNIASSQYEQCVDVPESGLSGLFGITKKQCYDVEIPAQIISNALRGGGKQNYYFLESELLGGDLIINAGSLIEPKSLEDLQTNYLIFDEKGLEIEVR